MPITTKFVRVVSYYDELPPIKPFDILITWSSKIALQTKIITFLYQSVYGYETW